MEYASPFSLPEAEPRAIAWPTAPAPELRDAVGHSSGFPGRSQADLTADEAPWEAVLGMVSKVYSGETVHPVSGKTGHCDAYRVEDADNPHQGSFADGGVGEGMMGPIEVLPPGTEVSVGDVILVFPAKRNRVRYAFVAGGVSLELGKVTAISAIQDFDQRCHPSVKVSIVIPSGDVEGTQYDDDPAHMTDSVPNQYVVRILPLWVDWDSYGDNRKWAHGLNLYDIVPIWRRGNYRFTMDVKYFLAVSSTGITECTGTVPYSLPCTAGSWEL